MKAISLAEKLDLFHEHWSPKIVAQLNDYHVKLVKVKGEFVWHEHIETDELFLVIKGKLRILLPNGTIVLHTGELFVVPKGVPHKPEADEECHVLLLEPKDTVNTGEVGGALTAPADSWI
ncbi:MAG: cupin domain-containing protein [Acidobacteria bacterium]|nr:cupin domain-containing protein [Acidobacteriota bacterium]